jgi:hypothetical protein
LSIIILEIFTYVLALFKVAVNPQVLTSRQLSQHIWVTRPNIVSTYKHILCYTHSRKQERYFRSISEYCLAFLTHARNQFIRLFPRVVFFDWHTQPTSPHNNLVVQKRRELVLALHNKIWKTFVYLVLWYGDGRNFYIQYFTHQFVDFLFLVRVRKYDIYFQCFSKWVSRTNKQILVFCCGRVNPHICAPVNWFTFERKLIK